MLVPALAIVAAACGGSGSGDSPPGTDASTTTAAEAVSTTTAAAAVSTTTTGDQPGLPPIDRPDLTLTVADGWTVQSLGAGVKPVLALDSSGSPAVAWLFEQVGEGFVAYSAAQDDWNGSAVRHGYFYGPIDLAFDPGDVPYIAYHDHQADDFDLALGDLTLVFPKGDRWTRDVIGGPAMSPVTRGTTDGTLPWLLEATGRSMPPASIPPSSDPKLASSITTRRTQGG
jgi:hypothetical protein